MKPAYITFTGIDDHTDFHHVKDLSKRYPIEWGILFGGSLKNGQRYPRFDTIQRALELASMQVRFSAHLCGFYANRAMSYGIAEGEMASVLGGNTFSRIQVNATKYDLDALRRFKATNTREVIIQVRGKTFPEPEPGLAYLHDESCGKGRTPAHRPIQEPHMPLVGYAGGIGPDNVVETIDGLQAHKYWLDMESKIRTDDWLDLDLCEAVCKLIWD